MTRPWRRSRRSLLAVLLTGLAAIAAQPVHAEDEISGPVRVVDAATLTVGGIAVRLHGIATPVPGDRCDWRDRTIDCGRVATTALLDLTAGATVRCALHADEAEPRPATCRADGYDLAEGMIYTGWARPTATAPARYRTVEEDARTRGRGLWQGRFPPAVDAAAD